MGSNVNQTTFLGQFSLTTYSTTQLEPLGAIRREAGKTYKYVNIKNTTATVAGAAGSLCAYGAAGGYDSNLVVLRLATDADASPICAGVTNGAVAGTAGQNYYGWIQIQGRVTLDTAVTNGSINSEFVLSTTNKTGTVRVDATVIRAAGFCIDATTGVVLACRE